MRANTSGMIVVLAGVVVGLASAAVRAADMVLLRDDGAASWGPAPPSLPKGLRFSVLAGNPDQPGPFTLRLKLPANVVIPPHTHATSENLTVLSGTIVHDMGRELDSGG